MMLDIASPTSDICFRRPERSARPIEAFLIPSIFGEEPPLCDLRERLQDTFCFDTLALPDVGARGSVLTDMVATGRGLADEIGRRQPKGSIVLMGFSFGASMALEVATQLVDAGRQLTFLGILDGPFDPPEVSRPAPHRLLKSAAVEAIESMDVVRRFVTKATPTEAGTSHRAEAMRRAMLWHLRSKALTRWSPRGCSAPGLHVSTGEYGQENRERWSDLCPNLDHVEIPVVHETLLRGEALTAVASCLRGSVKAYCF